MNLYHNVPKDEANRVEVNLEHLCLTHSERNLDAICNDLIHFKRVHKLDDDQMQYWYNLYSFGQKQI